jgi:hypothetical protein
MRMRGGWACLAVLVAISCPAPAQSGCASAPPGISAWFTFDEPMFRQPGEHRPQRVPGLVGSALRFNGIDQYFEVPASTPGLDVGEDDFTIEHWIRTKQSVGSPSIVDKRGHQPLGYLIFIYQGRPALQLADGSRGRGPFADASIADGRWHHVASVVKRLPPEPAALFVDGVRQRAGWGDVTLTNLDVPQPLWLGRHHANGYVDRENIYFQGDIDELTFYRRALTAAEIQSIFRAGAHGKCRAGQDKKGQAATAACPPFIPIFSLSRKD